MKLKRFRLIVAILATSLISISQKASAQENESRKGRSVDWGTISKLVATSDGSLEQLHEFLYDLPNHANFTSGGIAVLCQLLDADNRQTRTLACDALASAGKSAESQVSAVLHRSTNADTMVAAIQILGRIGAFDEDVASEYCRHPSAKVRASIAIALKPADTKSVQILAELLRDKKNVVQVQAAVSLQSITNSSEIVTNALRHAFGNKDIHATLLRTINAMGISANGVFPALFNNVAPDELDYWTRDQYENIFQNTGPPRHQDLPVLIELLDPEHPVNTRYIAELLSMVGATAQASLPKLSCTFEQLVRMGAEIESRYRDATEDIQDANDDSWDYFRAAEECLIAHWNISTDVQFFITSASTLAESGWGASRFTDIWKSFAVSDVALIEKLLRSKESTQVRLGLSAVAALTNRANQFDQLILEISKSEEFKVNALFTLSNLTTTFARRNATNLAIALYEENALEFPQLANVLQNSNLNTKTLLDISYRDFDKLEPRSRYYAAECICRYSQDSEIAFTFIKSAIAQRKLKQVMAMQALAFLQNVNAKVAEFSVSQLDHREYLVQKSAISLVARSNDQALSALRKQLQLIPKKEYPRRLLIGQHIFKISGDKSEFKSLLLDTLSLSTDRPDLVESTICELVAELGASGAPFTEIILNFAMCKVDATKAWRHKHAIETLAAIGTSECVKRIKQFSGSRIWSTRRLATNSLASLVAKDKTNE